MGRTARDHGESGIYHVVARGVGRQIIFEDDADRTRYLAELRRCLVGDAGGTGDADATALLAWCLMDNHVHLVVDSGQGAPSRLMRDVGSAYALYFNERHDRVGHLFQGRFRSEAVDDEGYLLTVVRYVHQNPVRAGIVDACEDYPWSSYRAYAVPGMEDGLTSRERVLEAFGGRATLRAFHEEVDEAAACVDVGRGGIRRLLDDADALEVARAVLGDVRPEEVASLPRPERDGAIRILRAARLSVRQVERLTGVSRGVISRA